MKRDKILAPAVALTMVGCAPAVMPEVSEATPPGFQLELDCSKTGQRPAFLENLTPGERVTVINRSTESVLFFDVRGAGQFAIWGEMIRQRAPGEVLVVNGDPSKEETIVRVIVGKPEFAAPGEDPRWYDAGSAVVVACMTPLQPPNGFFYPVESTAPTVSQG